MSWYKNLAETPRDSWNGEKTDFITKVVGVTYENRQQNIRRVKAGDPILLIREPDNPYDESAIAVKTETGLSLGFIKRELASDLAPRLDRLKRPVQGKVLAVTGGDPGRSLGVNITFSIP